MCGSASTVDQASMCRVDVAVRHRGGQTREAERGAFPRSFRCPRHRSYPPHGSRAYHFRPQLGLKSPPKTAEIGLKSAPRGPQNLPQIGPSGPRGRQEPFWTPTAPTGTPPGGPKLAPSWLKLAPSRPQIEPKRRPRGSGEASCTEVGSRSDQEALGDSSWTPCGPLQESFRTVNYGTNRFSACCAEDAI